MRFERTEQNNFACNHGEQSDLIEIRFIKFNLTSRAYQTKINAAPVIRNAEISRLIIAMMATKLNAKVIIKNLQNMHEKSHPPTGARRRLELAYQDWARLQGRGPRTGGPFDRTIGWRSW